METSGKKETRAYQNSTDAPSRRIGGIAGEIVQVCLVLVHDDHYPEEREAKR